MKIALFNGNNLGIVENDKVVDISQLAKWDRTKPQESLIEFMEQFETLRSDIDKYVQHNDGIALSEVTLNAPIPKPSKIVAAPVNYYLHQDEMNEQFDNAEYTIEKLGFFLKAPSSIIGPGETVRIPFAERRTDHEAEVAFLVSKQAKNVPASEAKNYIFGYVGLMDITVRGKEDRPWRKSFDTFTPVGPWIVTADEISDPNKLGFKLWVNEELRQSANTENLIYDCYKFFEVASNVMTLEPGDILTTGTPEGVGPITDGDTVTLEIEEIGKFSVGVTN